MGRVCVVVCVGGKWKEKGERGKKIKLGSCTLRQQNGVVEGGHTKAERKDNKLFFHSAIYARETSSVNIRTRRATKNCFWGFCCSLLIH